MYNNYIVNAVLSIERRMYMNNNYPQDNNNNFFSNNQGSQSPYGQPPPQQMQQPYYDNRMRVQESTAKSPTIAILIVVIVILLIAICLIGGYLFGKSRNDNGGGEQVPMAAAQTTAEPTEPPVTEAPAETAAQVTEAPTEAPTEPPTTETTVTAPPETSIVVKVVTEPPKTIFVGDYICDMRVATKSTDLNMRSSPSTSASIIGSIPKDTIVGYYGSEGSWGIVYYGGKYGYVNTAYLSADLYPADKAYGGNYWGGSVSYATINANGGLNLRSSDSTSASIITTIPYGKDVTVYSSYDGWSYISYGNDYGYVKSEYLKFK